MNVTKRDTKNGRFYEIDGELLPSVTTILQVIAKPYLVPWAAKLERELCLTVADQVYDELYEADEDIAGTNFSDLVRDRIGRMRAHQKEMDKACDIGSEIHAMIEWDLKADTSVPKPVARKESRIAYESWREWTQLVRLIPSEVERTLYSKKYGYAGTEDTFATLIDERTGERVRASIDWKSSKAIYNEYKLQNVAYRVARAEMEGRIDVPRGLIVRLPKSQDDKLLKTDRPFELCWVEPASELFPVFRAAQTLWQWQNAKKENK